MWHDLANVVFVMGDRSTSSAPRVPQVSGWRLVALYLYCLLLTTLAAALAAIIAVLPHWLSGLIR